MKFRVYTPTAGKRWTQYTAPAHLAPFIFLLWLVRGLRARLWGPPLGRRVTLDDMLAYHPGKKGKCMCTSGVLTTYRDGQRGVQFCSRMMTEFRTKAGFRCHNSKDGPRWIKGYEPERLVRR